PASPRPSGSSRGAVDLLMTTMEVTAVSNDLLTEEAANSEAVRLARNAAFSHPRRILSHGQSIDSAETLRVAQAGFENEQRKGESAAGRGKEVF
ncbi:MAG: hypothetical protein M1835_003772, partial [Candelina submexicana]